MLYQIRRMVLGSRDYVDITLQEYEAAKGARRGVLASLEIEEKLNLVLENYAEFELELQHLTTRFYLFHDNTWSSCIGDLQLVNRRFANLLSSSRLYIDQIKHDTSKLYGKASSQLQALEQSFSNQYDGNLGYRAMEALRNFAQHCSLPVHSLSYSTSRDERKNKVLMKQSCTPVMELSRLKEEGSFKAQVLSELEESPLNLKGKIDLKPLVRDYVRAIWAVHAALRERMKSDVMNWDSCIDDIVVRFKQQCGNETIGLAIVARDESKRVAESYHIFDEIAERRKSLERKNKPSGDLRNWYVTSEARNDD